MFPKKSSNRPRMSMHYRPSGLGQSAHLLQFAKSKTCPHGASMAVSPPRPAPPPPAPQRCRPRRRGCHSRIRLINDTVPPAVPPSYPLSQASMFSKTKKVRYLLAFHILQLSGFCGGTVRPLGGSAEFVRGRVWLWEASAAGWLFHGRERPRAGTAGDM